MCEFCIQHGEGKQWYLQVKNYARELMHTPLSPDQKKAIGFYTRQEWIEDFFRWNIVPAGGGKTPEVSQEVGETAPDASGPKTDEENLINRKIEHFGQVVPIEDVEKIIGLADSITRMPCVCRYDNRGLTNQRYCFGLGIDVQGMLTQYLDRTTSLEIMGKVEALQLIRQFDEEGLMHSVWAGVTPYVLGVCNCDGDCGAYRGYIRDHGMPSFFRAEYICQVDFDQCTGCRECMSQCQFGAQLYSSALGKVIIEPKMCFGCGVCRAACPQGAIALIPRAKSEVAANIW